MKPASSSRDESNDSTSVRKGASPAHLAARNSSLWAGSYAKASWNNSLVCCQRSGVMFWSAVPCHRFGIVQNDFDLSFGAIGLRLPKGDKAPHSKEPIQT